MRKLINTGIVSHIDAGKTTVTEQLLFFSGATRTRGSVDKGTAFTDFMEIEKNRGISVKMATTRFMWKDTQINLIDTPGHTDFAAEAERALQVLDCAVLVISAAEGVEARTELLWHALKTLNIPVIIFVNKIDRGGADFEKVKRQISEYLTSDYITVNQPVISEDVCAVEDNQDIAERLADFDDEILEGILYGEADFNKSVLMEKIKKGCINRTFFPLLCGSALKGVGIEFLLDCIINFFPHAEKSSGEPSGVIFKLDRDKIMGKVAFVRLYSGSLKTRDSIKNLRTGSVRKITQIRRFSGAHHEDVGYVESGDIAALYGLDDAVTGDILGSGENIPVSSVISQPLLQIRVYPAGEEEYPKLVEAMRALEEEEPLLNVEWVKEQRQLLINIPGTIQLEVIGEILKSRFDLHAKFGEPQVIYKETPSRPGIGFVSYTMPKPCWAVLKFEINPLPTGSGVRYESAVPDTKILYRYQNQVEKTIKSALRQGIKGWNVTDLSIRLIDGEHHNEHTHPLDFIVATPMAIMDGLRNTGTTLLEPYIKFRISVPEEYSGKVISYIVNSRGNFELGNSSEGRVTITGEAPVAETMDFPVRLAAMTAGRGALSHSFSEYKPCPDELGKTTPYRGVNPLDTSKYILYIRSALTDE